MKEDFYLSLNLPLIAAPMFLISGPELVIECCKNGIVGTFPALNQRTPEGFEKWVVQIKEALAEHEEKTGQKTAPFGVNLIVHPTNIRVKADLDICKKHNAIFHSDTVQTMAHFPFDMQKLNVDFMAASAHKFHGPKGVGFVYISENIRIKPLLRGGGQERNMRAGTENVYGIAALAMAMEMAYENLEEETNYIKGLKIYMMEKLQTELEDVQFYGKCTDMDNSLYTVLSCHFPETDIAEMLLFNLDILGVACSGGSACASGGSKGSHVLTEIVPESKRPGIRFSFSKYNTKEDIDFTIDKLKELFS